MTRIEPKNKTPLADHQKAYRIRKEMGFIRTLGSAASLILGIGLFYIALHYIPAYVGMQKVIAHSNLDTSAARLAKKDEISLLKAYLDPFRINKSYLRAGQSMQVQYALPEGAELEILIERCQPEFVVEIFKCEVVNQRKSTVKNETVGTQRFTFPDAGFYRFNEKVIQKKPIPENYRVIWSRA